jgi:microsomal dipeptidase-like Zn-dependent dipeptidase
MLLLVQALGLAIAVAAETPTSPRPVLGQIDWQAHPAMHLAWRFFDEGLKDKAPRRTFRHQFRQTVYSPYLKDSGVRIFMAAAMAAERARDEAHARELILAQLAYVEEFVSEHSEDYALVRSPEDARRVLASTDKTVVVHSIEGGRFVLDDPEDAAFWRDQGVALITVTHLYDDSLGGAAVNEGMLGPLVNRQGAKKRRKGTPRGLTDAGRAAIVALDEAGILVDLTHMSPEAVVDALELTAQHDIPPIVTHGKVASIRDRERSFTSEQIIDIYKQGGVFSLGLNGASLDPIDPSILLPDDVCWGTHESFQFSYETVNALLAQHAVEILGHSPMDNNDKTRLSVGWSSDWNGWTSHSRPKYGPRGCEPKRTMTDPLPIDTLGLAHPGLLPQHWQRLQENGADLEPMLRSAERFLQLWEKVQASDGSER